MLKLRNSDQSIVQVELKNLAEEKQQLLQQVKIKWSDFLYVRALRRPLLVTIVLQITQQFSGGVYTVK